ncbi:MAG: response regulator [Deltaproteobacteria bacterium]|nr:response regulator [Deltaproteobacteria bacterium]
MTEEEKARIKRLTDVVQALLRGKVPGPIEEEAGLDDELSQLTNKVNKLTENFHQIHGALIPLSLGKLDVELPRGNILASPFKQLQAGLRHLTWQTQRIAHGDFNQRVDFMGDFSVAFNTMTQALKESRFQMQADMEQLQQVAELKTRYLNIMAHDIRTPIGAIIGFANILLEGQLADDQRNFARIIKRSGESLLGLINNILDLAKLDKGKMEIVSEPFSLLTLGEDVGTLIQPKLKAGVKFIFQPDQGIPEQLLGDPHRLEQVLINLLGNAAKFTNQGSIQLVIRVEEEEVDQMCLHFAVSDTGIGISPQQVDHIFEPFAQADSSISSRFGGTGLGLAISRELVGLMGGELQVKSLYGQGTTFYFSLSLKQALPQMAGLTVTIPLTSRGKILVVDDSSSELELIGHLLKKEQVTFELCQESKRALALLVKAYEEKAPFTLALLDIMMPELDGLELARLIKSDPRFYSLRLVAYTGRVDSLNDANFPDFFSFVAAKPLSPETIRRIGQEAAQAQELVECPASLAGDKVLVVDDNPLNRMLVGRILKKVGVGMAEAENGLSAIEMVLEEAPDLVLMDQQMPVMDGAEAIGRIRESYRKEVLPILAFTADDSEEGQAAMIAAGADGIVNKPVNSDQLIEQLCNSLHRQSDEATG